MIQLDRVFKFYRAGKHVKIVLDHISTVFQSGRSYGCWESMEPANRPRYG